MASFVKKDPIDVTVQMTEKELSSINKLLGLNYSIKSKRLSPDKTLKILITAINKNQINIHYD